MTAVGVARIDTRQILRCGRMLTVAPSALAVDG
ncbi:hypothetical protein ABIB54_001486 [Frigoribacterium sp. UYMn621]